MADDSFEKLHLAFVQDLLPVGLAMIDRAKKGGAGKVVEAFTTSNEPLHELRVEGEEAAKSFRERLDQVSPGLGNPVVPVTVEVDDHDLSDQDIQDRAALLTVLNRIELRLELLEDQLREGTSAKPFLDETDDFKFNQDE